ncbi:hypothetical protein C7999DRAFT_44972 [Corynascus novoguineensis]|uniref:DUF676 domain-containing protein n=1 Tax=Corynascus novoguineensis TaxID=1126955 RepID=A0AAN7HK89_9PEZI|nr:hypothetical protein C7999DRAFT_44972 [Corynascus novoguineensis]
MALSKVLRLVDRTKWALFQEPRTLCQKVEHPQGLEVVSEGHEPIVDIVVLYGLNGHRERTWTTENGVYWLRDLLPEDLLQALSWQYLYDHAINLVSDLCRKRKLTNTIDKPIIFVAYSLGGLVLKSLGRVLANVASLVMLANDRLLKHLERDSEWLQQQLGQYASISNDFVTKYTFEEYETPTVLGHKIMVVLKASAVVPGHVDAEPIAIHVDHTSMARYSLNRDVGYVAVSEHLKIMEGEARADDARGRINRFAFLLSLSGVTETSHFKLYRQSGRCTVVLAIAYMKRHRNDYSTSIWLNTRDEAIVLDKDGDTSLAVRRWLDEPTNNRWLGALVRDGGKSGRHDEAGQPALEGYYIRQYLPDTDHGAVIVTTRSSTVQIGELLPLRKLYKIEDSLRILESISGRTRAQDDAAAMALACKLDGLPLALSTAGTYLRHISTSWRYYLEDYKNA